jgi:hypothetical protein
MAAPLDPARAVADLRALRELTGDERGAQRLAWTDTWARARAWLRERLAELPVEVDVDEAGNLWARLRGGSARTVILGSHATPCPTVAGWTARSGCWAPWRFCARWPPRGSPR